MAHLTVNHSGKYKDYLYKARTPFEVADADVDDVLAALGGDVLTVERTQKVEKEVKEKEDKMIRKNQVITK